MSATVRHLTTSRVAAGADGAKAAEAKAWLASRQAWELRLRELEGPSRVRVAKPAARQWARSA